MFFQSEDKKNESEESSTFKDAIIQQFKEQLQLERAKFEAELFEKFNKETRDLKE